MGTRVTAQNAKLVVEYVRMTDDDPKSSRKTPILTFNPDKPVVVAVRDERFILKYYAVLFGEAGPANEEILLRKARVVHFTGLSCDRVAQRAEELEMTVMEWIPEGTKFQGCCPIFGSSGEFFGSVGVSGQDHILYDQPMASYIAKNYWKLLKEALESLAVKSYRD